MSETSVDEEVSIFALDKHIHGWIRLKLRSWLCNLPIFSWFVTRPDPLEWLAS